MDGKYQDLIAKQVCYFSGEDSARCADKIRIGISRETFIPIGIDSKNEEELFNRYGVESKDELIEEVNKMPEMIAFIDSQKKHGICASLDYRYNDSLNNYMLYVKLTQLG
jgi:SAM-dependent MidA family methyltransferase